MAKIDCEGAELKVLAGADETLRERRVDYLAVEFHSSILGEDNCEKLRSMLAGHGYQAARLCGHEIFYRADLANEVATLELS